MDENLDRKDILHLVTQRNQPYGSRRKCCERCGRAISAFHINEYYVEYQSEYHPDKRFRLCEEKP